MMIARRRAGREAAQGHRFAQARLSAYLDRELSPPDLRRVHDHLSSCGQCSRQIAQLRRVVTVLKRVRSDGRSDPVIDALIKRLARETDAHSKPATEPFPSSGRLNASRERSA